MNVGHLCKRAIVTIDASSTLRETARKVLAHRIGAIVVKTQSQERRDVLGLVTDRDLSLSCVAHELDPAAVLVGAIASRDLACVLSSCGSADASVRLAQAGVRRLPVCEDDGRLVGLLSSDDLPGALVEPLNTPVGAFRAGIQREQARHDPSVVAPPATMFLPPLERTELA